MANATRLRRTPRSSPHFLQEGLEEPFEKDYGAERLDDENLGIEYEVFELETADGADK